MRSKVKSSIRWSQYKNSCSKRAQISYRKVSYGWKNLTLNKVIKKGIIRILSSDYDWVYCGNGNAWTMFVKNYIVDVWIIDRGLNTSLVFSKQYLLAPVFLSFFITHSILTRRYVQQNGGTRHEDFRETNGQRNPKKTKTKSGN